MTDVVSGGAGSSNQLLDVKEQIRGNLSSQQIEIMLDKFLYGALEPIIKNTNLTERVLSSVLVQYQSDNRRKISAIDKQKLFNYILIVINTRDSKTRWQVAKKLHLERTIWINIIEIFFSITDGYLELETKLIRATKKNNIHQMSQISGQMYDIEKQLNCNRNILSAVIRWTRHYHNLYLSFKRMIFEKYIRHVWNESTRSVMGTNLMIDRDDLFKNMLLGVNRAIDKYDSNKGTLTSYISQWLMNSKTNPDFQHQYGHSYTVSSTGRRRLVRDQESGEGSQSNWAQPLDEVVQYESPEIGAEQRLIKEVENDKLLRLANKAIDSEVPLLLLDIPVAFSEQDKDELRQQSPDKIANLENKLEILRDPNKR